MPCRSQEPEPTRHQLSPEPSLFNYCLLDYWSIAFEQEATVQNSPYQTSCSFSLCKAWMTIRRRWPLPCDSLDRRRLIVACWPLLCSQPEKAWEESYELHLRHLDNTRGPRNIGAKNSIERCEHSFDTPCLWSILRHSLSYTSWTFCLHASCPTSLSLAIMDRLAGPHVACKMQQNLHPSTDSCIGYLLLKQLFPYCGYTSPRIRLEELFHVSLLVDPRNTTV